MVCFVILHYMVTEETQKCVDSIKNNVEGEKKIIIVDNASPNHSNVELHNLYDGDEMISLIENETNEGFARGNNVGYRYAVERYNPDFIVVMNNDMEIIQKDFIDLIYRSFSEYNFYILGPDIFSTKKRYHQNPQTRKVPDKQDLKRAYRKLRIKKSLSFLLPAIWKIRRLFSGKKTEDTSDYESRPFVQDVVVNPLLHGSCYVFSKLFIEKHPSRCFYEKTFMYMEAEILYYQAIRNQEKMIYYPGLQVDHHEDKSTDAEFKEQSKKSLFSIQCLAQSVGAFIKLMEEDEQSAV